MGSDLEDFFLPRILFLIPILLCLSVHEWAHAWSARRLGDDTAELLGRLTLNPLAHVDPFGTFLLPLLGVPFGWAKPVPVQPTRFRPGVSLRAGMVAVALAGPISNVVLAVLSAGALMAVLWMEPELLYRQSGVVSLLELSIDFNVLLALFNMLPVPPLDGSRVVDGILPDRFRRGWDAFTQLGPAVLIAVIVLPLLGGFSLFDAVLDPLDRAILHLEAIAARVPTEGL